MKRGSMVVYDFNDDPKVIELPDKEIESIAVAVLFGSETGIVNFEDGTTLEFDADEYQKKSFYDGFYIVKGDKLAKWLDFNATGKKYLSSTRQKEV